MVFLVFIGFLYPPLAWKVFLCSQKSSPKDFLSVVVVYAFFFSVLSEVNKRGRPSKWPSEWLPSKFADFEGAFSLWFLGENMTPKEPFLEGTFWDKFWRPLSLPGAFVYSRYFFKPKSHYLGNFCGLESTHQICTLWERATRHWKMTKYKYMIELLLPTSFYDALSIFLDNFGLSWRTCACSWSVGQILTDLTLKLSIGKRQERSRTGISRSTIEKGVWILEFRGGLQKFHNSRLTIGDGPKIGDGLAWFRRVRFRTPKESTVSHTRLSELFGPHSAPEIELSEFLWATYVWGGFQKTLRGDFCRSTLNPIRAAFWRFGSDSGVCPAVSPTFGLQFWLLACNSDFRAKAESFHWKFAPESFLRRSTAKPSWIHLTYKLTEILADRVPDHTKFTNWEIHIFVSQDQLHRRVCRSGFQ